MGKNHIEQKLSILLSKTVGSLEESHVVYLFVELRKLLEKDSRRASKYPLLRFYADWCVHTQKDRISPEIENVACRIFEAATKTIRAGYPKFSEEKSDIEKFAHLDELKQEMGVFLSDFNLPVDVTLTDEAWCDFANCLIKILEEQPIIKPTSDIESIYFEPANQNCVSFVVRFANQIDGRQLYRYSNVLC